MSLVPDSTLKSQSQEVRFEIDEGANTAERVGKLFEDIVDSKISMNGTTEQNPIGGNLYLVNGQALRSLANSAIGFDENGNPIISSSGTVTMLAVSPGAVLRLRGQANANIQAETDGGKFFYNEKEVATVDLQQNKTS